MTTATLVLVVIVIMVVATVHADNDSVTIGDWLQLSVEQTLTYCVTPS